MMAIDPSVIVLVVMDFTLLVMAVSVAVLGVGAWWWARALSAVANARAHLAEAARVEATYGVAGAPAEAAGGEYDPEHRAGVVAPAPFTFEDHELVRAVQGTRRRREAGEERIRTIDEASGFDPQEPPVPSSRAYAEVHDG